MISCLLLDLLSFEDFFFGEEKFSLLPSKKKVADENLPLWTSFFLSPTLFFIRQCPEFFFYKKNRQMKAGQNNKYDITKTSGLLEV